jgi:hypothetical protein
MHIRFSFPSEYGDFNDALVLPDDHDLTDAEIEAMKVQRFESWRAFVKAASQVVTPEPDQSEPVAEVDPDSETPAE